MRIKIAILDDEGNEVAVSFFETDVVDQYGDILTTKAFMASLNNFEKESKAFSIKHSRPA